MKLTNKANLPLPIVNAVKNDTYSKGAADISITGLIGSARIAALTKQHWDDIEEDVSDRVWSLYGQIIHGIFERAADPTEALTEERLFIERFGWTLSGQFDRMAYHGNVLQDYKMTSTYSVNNGPKPEWIAQLNCYRLLLIENGHTADKLQIVCLFRDWSKAKAKNSPDYPQLQVGIVDIPVWPIEQTEAFIRERLQAHGTAHQSLPECTDEERWKSPDVFAVVGEGNTRASKTYPDLEAAEADAQERSAKGKKQYHVESRTGENRRCADYCAVSAFCSQWKAINPDRLGLMGGNKAA